MRTTTKPDWPTKDLHDCHRLLGCRTRLLVTLKRACNLLLGGFYRDTMALTTGRTSAQPAIIKSTLVPCFTQNPAEKMAMKAMSPRREVCPPIELHQHPFCSQPSSRQMLGSAKVLGSSSLNIRIAFRLINQDRKSVV